MDIVKKILFALLFANIGAFITALQKDKEILTLQKRVKRLSDEKALRTLWMKGYTAGYAKHEIDCGIRTLEHYVNQD